MLDERSFRNVSYGSVQLNSSVQMESGCCTGGGGGGGGGRRSRYSGPIPPPTLDALASPQSFSSGGSDSSLSKLVTLQAAEGYWSLDTGLASIIGRSLSDLKSASPSGCSDVVWGTLLAIVLLESRFSSQHDEWELVAMKAEMWLQGQALPPGSSISSLKETALQSLP